MTPYIDKYFSTYPKPLNDFTPAWLSNYKFDFIISYGYHHIIKEPWLSKYAGRMINLHISLLPWNRGADPNYWSWRDHTPKGVTIHQIDAGIDTGPILAQAVCPMTAGHTLRSSYEALHAQMVALFAATWPGIRAGTITPTPQSGGGSFHRKSDCTLPPLDTPVEMIERGLA